jgi:hypothetical protein
MAEPQFTEAGQFGRNLRGALANAYRGFNSGFTNYVQEPLLNLYPQVIANPTYAATEAVAGALDVPLNLGRFPYYEIETENERANRLVKESEPPEPAPTLANRDLLSEYYGGFDNVPVRKAEAVSKKNEPLNYVVKTYGENPTSEIFTNKEQARAALKKLYSQNKKATMSNVPESQAEQFAVGQMEKTAKNKEAIRKLRNPQTEEEILAVAENKGRMEDAWAAANEAKRAKDKGAAAGFDQWRSDVKVRRSSEGAVNRYSQQLGLLKQAYSQARQSGDPIGALRLSQAIQAFQSDVPKEMGARKKYFEQNAVRERDAMLAEKARLAQEEDEKNRRIALANPDYIYSNPFSGRANFTYQ